MFESYYFPLYFIGLLVVLNILVDIIIAAKDSEYTLKQRYANWCNDGERFTFWSQVVGWLSALFVGIGIFILALVTLQWLDDKFDGE